MDSKPYILLLAGELRLRGGTAYTLRLARHLPESGFRVQLIADNARQLSRDVCRDLGVREITHMTTPLVSRIVLRLLCGELQEDPPALIHIQSRSMLKVGTWLASRLRVPYVVTVHDYLGDRDAFRLHPVWGRRVVAVSDSVRNDLLERTGLNPDQVVVVRSGVDVGSNEEVHEPLDPGQRPVVGTAGVLERVKGIHFFLGAAREVLNVFPDAQFVVAGSGPEEVPLRQLARELELGESVTFVPSLHDFSAAISAMDIFCLPSLKQGLGTIMLEAMALGRPVIATKTGGVFSIVKDRETGLVVAPGQVEELTARILELLRDPELARRLGRTGQELVAREYRVGQMVERTIDVYNSILEPVAEPQTA